MQNRILIKGKREFYSFRTPYLFWQNKKPLGLMNCWIPNENLRLCLFSIQEWKIKQYVLSMTIPNDNPTKWLNWNQQVESVIIDKFKAQGIKLRAGSVLSK
jgi:hypothetical protein